MFSDATRHRGPLLAPAVVRTVLRAMGVPADPGNTLRIRRASGACARYGDQLVAAESAQFLRRVHASGFPIPSELLDPPPPEPGTLPAGAPRCAWITDYIPRALPPGQALLANVRFANTGTAPLFSQGPSRIAVAFEWQDASGQPVAVEDYRTPLPVDLPPGQALTLPVRLIPPSVPGTYQLTLRLLRNGEHVLPPEYGPLRITLREGAGFTPPAHWQLNTQPPSGYVADQERGTTILRSWLPDDANLRMLEIGGNAKPVLAHFPGEHYNVDVDLLGLQVGQIVQGARRRAADLPGEIGFICADAHHLPFAEAFFDAIVMFASLHHVPRPAEFLRRLRAHLRPGRFHRGVLRADRTYLARRGRPGLRR